jgi:hypothetical protein
MRYTSSKEWLHLIQELIKIIQNGNAIELKKGLLLLHEIIKELSIKAEKITIKGLGKNKKKKN